MVDFETVDNDRVVERIGAQQRVKEGAAVEIGNREIVFVEAEDCVPVGTAVSAGVGNVFDEPVRFIVGFEVVVH